MKNKIPKIEHSSAKRKSATETVAPVECVFCEENERDLPKMSRNQKVLRNDTQQGNTTRFQISHVYHVESFTEQWKKMTSELGKIEILSDQKQQQINHLIVQWTFFENSRKVITSIRKAISSLYLILNKHFDKKGSKPY